LKHWLKNYKVELLKIGFFYFGLKQKINIFAPCFKNQFSLEMNNILKKFLPHLLVVALFIIVSFAYFYPVLKGKDLPQMDNTHALGMANEILQYEKLHPGEEFLWTNSMFGGMPAYQIKGTTTYSVYLHLHRLLRFGLPYTTVAIFFTYLLAFYLLLISLNVNKWLSFAGSLAFALSSYNVIIVAAGHITKTYAIAWMAPVMAGVILAYNRKYILGGVIATVALGLEIASNHVQITYYLMLAVLMYGVIQFIYCFLQKEIKHYFKASGVLIVAAILAIIPNINQLWLTYEYGKDTIRGESELATEKGEKKSSGLDKNYALSWSYGIAETFTLMIPNVQGGASDMIGNNESILKDVDSQYKELVSQQSSYFGAQPFTSGPVYVGAVICFLFILGLFIVKGPIKWWLLGATVLSIMLSWGHNLMWFTDIFFYYVPFYNKFRTVSMSLVLAQVTVPLLAILAVKEIIDNPKWFKEQIAFTIKKLSKYWYATGVALLITLSIYMFAGSLDLITYEETSQFDQYRTEQPQYGSSIDAMIDNMIVARKAIVKADALRSFFFVLMGALLIFAYGKMNWKKEFLIVGLALLFTIDMWLIDRRYLNADQFVEKQVANNQFPASKADQLILKDKDLSFRVFNVTRNPFTEVNTSYFHKSIGGYHGAKLRRYQDLIDKYLGKSIAEIRQAAQNADKIDINQVYTKQNVLNMLNAKYIIIDDKSFPLGQINFNACGSAWFVDNYKAVNTPDEELAELELFDPNKTAIVNQSVVSKLTEVNNKEFFPLDSGTIVLTSYKPTKLTYDAETKHPKIAVFSEIYYDKGWKAFIDGKPVEHIRVNYVLRGLVVPTGKHKIEFVFDPDSYNTSQSIALGSSITVVILILGALFYHFKTTKTEPTPQVEKPISNPVKEKKKGK